MKQQSGCKRIAALTMVRNDDFFLRRWVAYYSEQLGASNLYVFFDGTDQVPPECCAGVNVAFKEHEAADVHRGDRIRIDHLSGKAAELFAAGYDMVIGTDVDEFLIVDPVRGVGLAEFLSALEGPYVSFSGLGIDVGQNLNVEKAVDDSLPLLGQRRFAKLSTRYSKATVLREPRQWGSGFHRVRGCNFHIVKDLYLFHFGCVDLGRIKARMSGGELVDDGWSRHLAKRAGTIRLVSRRRAGRWSMLTPAARRVQNVIRPPYAWNKPAMFEARLVVEIPERFKGIV